MHYLPVASCVHSQFSTSLIFSTIRGHVRTILGKINVIVTLGVRAMTLSHLTCIETLECYYICDVKGGRHNDINISQNSLDVSPKYCALQVGCQAESCKVYVVKNNNSTLDQEYKVLLMI
jgi:hypothetical protein